MDRTIDEIRAYCERVIADPEPGDWAAGKAACAEQVLEIIGAGSPLNIHKS